MQKLNRTIVLIAVFIVVAASLAACSPASQPTPTAAVLNLPAVGSDQKAPAGQPTATQGAGQPAQPNPTAYAAPAVEGQPNEAAANAYPGPTDKQNPAPQSVPARENRSKVTATLIDPVSGPNEAGRMLLHVKIVTSEEVQGMPSFTQDKVNTEIDLEVEPAGLPELNPGDTFTAFVSYMGDEKGGKYIGSELTKP